MRVILETITGRKGIKNFSSLEEYVDFMTKNGDKIKNIIESDLPYDDKPVSVAAPSQSNGWEQVNKATFGDVIKKAEKGECVLPHKAASVFKDEAKFEPSKASEKADSQEGDVPQFKYDEPKSEEPKEEKVEAPKAEEPKEAPKSEEKENSEEDKEKKEEIDEGFKDKFKKAVATGAMAASLAAGNAHGMTQDPYYDGATRPYEDSYEQVSDYEKPQIKQVKPDGTIVDQYGNEFTKEQFEALLRGEDPFNDNDIPPEMMNDIEEALKIAGVQLNEGEEDPMETALACIDSAMDDFGPRADDNYLRSVCEDCAKEYGVDVKKLYHAYTGHKWSALDKDEEYDDVDEDVNNPNDGDVDEKTGKEKLMEEEPVDVKKNFNQDEVDDLMAQYERAEQDYRAADFYDDNYSWRRGREDGESRMNSIQAKLKELTGKSYKELLDELGSKKVDADNGPTYKIGDKFNKNGRTYEIEKIEKSESKSRDHQYTSYWYHVREIDGSHVDVFTDSLMKELGFKPIAQ